MEKTKDNQIIGAMEKTKDNQIMSEADEMDNNRAKLLQLDRTPKECPLGDCDVIIFPSRLLSHFIASHLLDLDSQIRPVFDSQRSLLLFNAKSCPFGKNMCLGALAYAGYKGDPTTVPGKRFVCYPNFDLFHNYESYAQHLPVLIMCARTSWPSLTPKKRPISASASDCKSEEQVYVIWCTTCSNLLKLHVTMTMYDMKYSQSRSCIRLIRDFAETSCVSEFLLSETNYMLLTSNDIKKMSDPKNDSMLLEIILHEDTTLNRRT